MSLFPSRLWTAAGAAVLLASASAAAELRVEVGNTRSPGEIGARVESAVKEFGRRAAALTDQAREATALRVGRRVQFSLPVTVVLTRNGEPLPARSAGPLAPGDLIPTFDASGSRVFPAAYQTLLTDTFSLARPAMNSFFGAPKTGGIVRVRSYDADIQDRYAVAGGYYVPNGPDGPEIRLPVYNSQVSAAINYIHCLLLAYRGDASYITEAWNEGLVRAVTMVVARTPGSLPGAPASDDVEATLDSLYDLGGSYDWVNRPGIGANPFIAPNLLNLPLPPGGSTGGPYLLRYQLAGTAWAKALVQHPGFIAELNRRFYLNPAAYATEPALLALAQTALDAASGPGSTVEGFPLADWAMRQAILDPSPAAGTRAMLQPFPIAAGSGTSDFGVFGVVVNAWKSQINGDETLLSGRAYPIYWRPDSLRFFTAVQDDQVDLAGGYGAVAPNFPSSQFGGQIYRVGVDLPFQNQTARTWLPAGAVSTGAGFSGTFYGALVGFPALTGGAVYRVSVEWPGSGPQTATVSNMAFGLGLSDPAFMRSQPLTVRVFRVEGASVTELMVRRVNKTPGPIGLELHAPGSDSVFTLNRPSQVRIFGLPIQPWRDEASAVLGLAPNQVLAAGYNSILGRYELYPEDGRLQAGQGFFHRGPSAAALNIPGRQAILGPATVSLRPGWNMVAAPLNEEVPFGQILATAATEGMSGFAAAQGTLVGTTLFRWAPDPLNPDSGAYQPADRFVPGEALYVRALRTEGVALAFFPASSPPPARPASPAPAPQRIWEARLNLTASGGLWTQVRFGQATGATLGEDPRLDSQIPPGFGGLHAWVGQNLFRDMRPWGGTQSYRIQLEGLVPGRSYTLGLPSLAGSVQLTLFRDSFQGTPLRAGSSIRFTAKAAQETLTVLAQGAR